MRQRRGEILHLDHHEDPTSLTTPWVPHTDFVSPTTHTPWLPDYYYEDGDKPNKFGQISTLIIFVIGMSVLVVVLYQFVYKKCKEDDLPPQRAEPPLQDPLPPSNP